jgi:hypothetical protein
VNLNLLSSTTIEDMEDEDVKLSYLGEDINKYQKVYTEEDYKNVNRQPKKEVRIPKVSERNSFLLPFDYHTFLFLVLLFSPKAENLPPSL